MILDLFIITPLIIFIAALICEFIDSHMGGGFGTILTPLFLIFGFPRLSIVNSILVSEIVTGFEGGGLYHSFKKVDWKAAGALSVTAIMGIFIAVIISVEVSSFVIKLYIGILVAVLGVLMLLKLKCKIYKT